MGAARVPQPLTQVFATRTFLAGPTDGSVRQTPGKTWAKKDSSRHLRKKVPDSQRACAKVPNVSSHRENANKTAQNGQNWRSAESFGLGAGPAHCERSGL